ncbi:PAS domain-containing protein [Flavobacterium sp.]
MSKKYNLNNMLCLDIYLSSCSDKEYQKAKKSIGLNKRQFPLLSWGIRDGLKLQNGTIKEVDLIKLSEFQKNFQWNIDLNVALKQPYEALIVTDATQNIFWVNNGFSNMTGYSREFAVGKTPRFLQGQNTSVEIKERIKNKIKEGKIFKERIINYQKNNDEYLCEVTVIPIKNKYDINTHFIALERKIA